MGVIETTLNYPITYIAVIIWLIWISFKHDEYWANLVIRFSGVMFGIIIALQSAFGEIWLNVNDTTAVYTLTQQNTGLEPTLSILIILIDMAFLIMIGLSLQHGDYKRTKQ